VWMCVVATLFLFISGNGNSDEVWARGGLSVAPMYDYDSAR